MTLWDTFAGAPLLFVVLTQAIGVAWFYGNNLIIDKPYQESRPTLLPCTRERHQIKDREGRGSEHLVS